MFYNFFLLSITVLLKQGIYNNFIAKKKLSPWNWFYMLLKKLILKDEITCLLCVVNKFRYFLRRLEITMNFWSKIWIKFISNSKCTFKSEIFTISVSYSLKYYGVKKLPFHSQLEYRHINGCFILQTI